MAPLIIQPFSIHPNTVGRTSAKSHWRTWCPTWTTRRASVWSASSPRDGILHMAIDDWRATCTITLSKRWRNENSTLPLLSLGFSSTSKQMFLWYFFCSINLHYGFNFSRSTGTEFNSEPETKAVYQTLVDLLRDISSGFKRNYNSLIKKRFKYVL